MNQIETIHALTVRDPLLRRSIGETKFPASWTFDELSFPLLIVEVPHQHSPRVRVLHTLDELIDDANDGLTAVQCIDEKLCKRDPESLTDLELLQLLAHNLFALHLIAVPSGENFRIEIPVSARHNFPWRRVTELICEEVGV
jgi:hypothetical protein